MQGPQIHRWNVETCEIAVNSARKLFWVFLPTTYHSSKRTIGRPKSVQYNAMGHIRVDSHTCGTLSSNVRGASYGPKNGLRSNIIASKFKKFSGGTCPHLNPLAVACLRAHYEPDHSKPGGYRPDMTVTPISYRYVHYVIYLCYIL